MTAITLNLQEERSHHLMDFLSNYQAAEDELSSLVVNEQKTQLKTLKTQVAELKAQLRAKNDLIRNFENDNTNDEISDIISLQVSKIVETFDNREIQDMDTLRSIVKETDVVTQLQTLFDYMWKNLLTPKATVKRLCSIVKENATFLINVAQDSELRKEITNAPLKDSQRAFVAQAEKTVQEIRDFKGISKSQYGSLGDVFQPDFNGKHRENAIRKILNNNNIEKDELQALFLQEVSITSTLAKIANENTKSIDILKNSGVHSPESPFYIQAKITFGAIEEALGDPKTKMTSENFFQRAQDLAERISDARNSLGVSASEFWPTLRDLIEQLHTLETLNTQNRSLLAMQSAALAEFSEGGAIWVQWAERLSESLGLEATGNTALREAIEDAAIRGAATLTLDEIKQSKKRHRHH